MKKVRLGLKLMLALVLGWFTVDAAATCVSYWMEPQRWVAQSAPWYTGIIVHGAAALAVAAALGLALWAIRKK